MTKQFNLTRTCIWCSRNKSATSFKKKAHTIPRSLGGKKICEEVCDSCNSYFGSPGNQKPSIEVAFKELFNISKHVLLRTTGDYKKTGRYKSEFFKVNWNTYTLNMKPRYKSRSFFQEKLARQLRRGFYKVFLEERSRVVGDAHNNCFDFIRAFARYDLGDYPLYYFTPVKDWVFFSTEDALEPELKFVDHHNEIMTKFGFYEFYFMGHYFSIPTSINYNLTWDLYLKHVKTKHSEMYSSMVKIKRFDDVDFAFSYVKD